MTRSTRCSLLLFLFCLLSPAGREADASLGLLEELLNLDGRAGTHQRGGSQSDDALTQLTQQGLALLSYVGSVSRNPPNPRPARRGFNRLLHGVAERERGGGATRLLDGVPVVPAVSLPGLGACLPKGLPFVNGASPNVFQDLLRSIPGAQDVLRGLAARPNLRPRALLGNWHWVIVTPSVHNRFCATSEFKPLTSGVDGQLSFSIFDSFREGSENGAPKVSFGYGVLSADNQLSVYMQSDPCPYQAVLVGPRSRRGQYDWMVLSNWAKYPVVGLVRNLRLYRLVYRRQMEAALRKAGYIGFFSEMFSSLRFLDSSRCRPISTGNVVSNLLNGLLFG